MTTALLPHYASPHRHHCCFLPANPTWAEHLQLLPWTQHSGSAMGQNRLVPSFLGKAGALK